MQSTSPRPLNVPARLLGQQWRARLQVLQTAGLCAAPPLELGFRSGRLQPRLARRRPLATKPSTPPNPASPPSLTAESRWMKAALGAVEGPGKAAFIQLESAVKVGGWRGWRGRGRGVAASERAAWPALCHGAGSSSSGSGVLEVIGQGAAGTTKEASRRVMGLALAHCVLATAQQACGQAHGCSAQEQWGSHSKYQSKALPRLSACLNGAGMAQVRAAACRSQTQRHTGATRRRAPHGGVLGVGQQRSAAVSERPGSLTCHLGCRAPWAHSFSASVQ